MLFYIFSPLEQFRCLPLISIGDFLVISNVSLIIFLIIFLLSFLVFFLFKNPQKNLYLVPTRFQYVLESFYLVVYNLVDANIGVSGRPFFSYIFTLFLLVVLSNTVGLVPYSFTITSHIIVTFSLAICLFVGSIILSIKIHGQNLASFFLPAGSPFFLSLLLVPIEIVSFLFRPISLSVRLFANMMAGHALLKVIISFAWTMSFLSGGLAIFHLFPLAVIVLLMFLEFGVALIQAYVFTILTCFYINDALHLH
jgi:ATP synthase subunit 6